MYATIIGAAIVRLKIMTIVLYTLTTGAMRRTAAGMIITGQSDDAVARSEEADVDLEQPFDFRHHLLVDHEYDHVVVGLDHGVVVRDDHLHVARHRAWLGMTVAWPLLAAHDGADGGALGQIDFLDAAADDARRLVVAVGDLFDGFGGGPPPGVGPHGVAVARARP